MSYDKNTWATGDMITAQKLNHMEDGISGGGDVLVVNAIYDEQTDIDTLDKTWQEIYDSAFAVVILDEENAREYKPVSTAYIEGGHYVVEAGNVNYHTSSADGYPDSSTPK